MIIPLCGIVNSFNIPVSGQEVNRVIAVILIMECFTIFNRWKSLAVNSLAKNKQIDITF